MTQENNFTKHQFTHVALIMRDGTGEVAAIMDDREAFLFGANTNLASLTRVHSWAMTCLTTPVLMHTGLGTAKVLYNAERRELVVNPIELSDGSTFNNRLNVDEVTIEHLRAFFTQPEAPNIVTISAADQGNMFVQ